MVATLRETKTNLSHLLGLVEQGQEIVITVRGKPRARLVGIPTATQSDMATWKTELEGLRARFSTGKASTKAEEIIANLRAERL